MELEKFNLETMTKPTSILIIGKRGSGKSIIARDILNSIRDKTHVGIAISPKNKTGEFYSIPETCVHCDFQSKIIEKILFDQKTIIKKSKENKQLSMINDAFVIMDDCLFSKSKWHKDPIVTELIFNGRFHSITYILTAQHPLELSPEAKCNFDYVFLLYDDNIKNQKKMYQQYGGMFSDFESFRQIYNQLTENFGAMVISNRAIFKTFMHEKIFYYNQNMK